MEGGNQEYDLNHILWKTGMNSYKCFLEDFCDVEQVSLYLTKEVLRDRKQLEVAHQAFNSKLT